MEIKKELKDFFKIAKIFAEVMLFTLVVGIILSKGFMILTGKESPTRTITWVSMIIAIGITCWRHGAFKKEGPTPIEEKIERGIRYSKNKTLCGVSGYGSSPVLDVIEKMDEKGWRFLFSDVGGYKELIFKRKEE